MSVRKLIMVVFGCILLCVCVCRKMMEVCGEAENRLASVQMQHEVHIEKEILDPLNQLTEVKQTLSLFSLIPCVLTKTVARSCEVRSSE